MSVEDSPEDSADPTVSEKPALDGPRRSKSGGAGSMRWRGRVEEAAPGVVLFALAATVIMITAGIVFVLFESGSKFYRGFGCGVDAYKPPQDWHEDVKAGIKEAAIYDDGKLSDPLWLDAFCIVGWDMAVSYTHLTLPTILLV